MSISFLHLHQIFPFSSKFSFFPILSFSHNFNYDVSFFFQRDPDGKEVKSTASKSLVLAYEKQTEKQDRGHTVFWFFFTKPYAKLTVMNCCTAIALTPKRPIINEVNDYMPAMQVFRSSFVQ